MTRALAVVVSTATDVEAAGELALAGRDAGIEVGMFFMDRAVGELPRLAAMVAALVEAGCELVACGSSAHERGLSEADVGVLLGSQDDHAALVHKADRTVAFT